MVKTAEELIIEEKLAAIKAINDDKEKAEKSIEAILKIKEEHSTPSIVISIQSNGRELIFTIPTEIITKGIYEYYANKSKELIKQAESLMK